MKYSYHRLSKESIFLGSNEIKLYFQDLFLTEFWNIDLNLQIHKSSALRHFLKVKLTVLPVLEFVVTFNHRWRVPRYLSQIAYFELKRDPCASLRFFVKLIVGLTFFLERKSFNYSKLLHHLFCRRFLSKELF